MPRTSLLYHHLSGPFQAPLLVLGPSLGTSMRVWEPHLPLLTQAFRVLRFDLPGHGGSSADLLSPPHQGGTTVEELADLVYELTRTHMHRHRQNSFHYAGISLGGAIGAQLALQRPETVASLTMVCSSAHFGAPDQWYERADLVREQGLAPLLATSPGRWFADSSTVSASPTGRMLLRDLAHVDPVSYEACCNGLARYDLRPALDRVNAPTLVIGGTHDVATPPAHAEELALGIPGAILEMHDIAHLAIEGPPTIAESVARHIGAKAT